MSLSLCPGVALLVVALLCTSGPLTIAMVHCRKEREEKLGCGLWTVERFLVHMTILWRYIGYTWYNETPTR